MSPFEEKIEAIVTQADALLADSQRSQEASMPGETYVLDDNEILARPRNTGYSRYPYGQDGFNFWVYASGYMHCNEGLFSHFLRAAEGQEPNIAFFAGLPKSDGSFGVVPLMPVPRNGSEITSVAKDQYTVLSSSAAYFVTTLADFRFVLRAFVTAAKEICFSLHVHQLTERPQRLFLSSYFNPFLRNQIFESGEDRWFKEVSTLEGDEEAGRLGGFLVKVNEDKDRLSSVSHYGVIQRGLILDQRARLSCQERTTSRYQYVGGSRSSLHTATSLAAGTFGQPQPICTFTETGVAGDLLHLEMDGQATVRFDAVFQCTDDAQLAREVVHQPTDNAAIDTKLDALERDDIDRHSSMTVTVGGDSDQIKQDVFNGFVEHLKRQVEFCSLIKGYVQLSHNSLIGIRDVFQALESLAFWRPTAVRVKTLEALGYTSPDGRCFRQYSLPSSTGDIGRMDLRPFIDQGVWVISAITTYLRVTGDVAFLDEECGYHEIVDEDRGIVRPSDRRDSVLNHLLRIMDFMLSKRDHDLTGCVRALYGDWNDALDGLGISRDPSRAYGSGVSVMVTMQVYQNCHEMIELLRTVDPTNERYPARMREYEDAAKELHSGLVKHAVVTNEQGQKRIVHGWGDRRDYLIGSYNDPDGKARDGLTSNAFWVLSGVHDQDPSYAAHILEAFDRLDDKYGLKTFEPYFAEDAPGVGRIRKLPAGTAENGATYVHATAFAIMALFRMGESQKAWDQLIKILPFTDIHENLSHSPFVMPNAYGHNAEKFIDGQNMNDWQTGSSNVVLKLLVRYVFGFEPMMGGLWVQPAAWFPFKSFDFSIRVRDCDVKIGYQNQGGSERTFTVNGQPTTSTRDPILKVDKIWIPYDQFTGRGIDIRVTQ